MLDRTEQIFAVVRRVPRGKVTTYGAIAAVVGTTARVVGWTMNRSPSDVPAHRVVNSVGKLTGRHHFPEEDYMAETLRGEGIEVEDNKVAHFKRHLWVAPRLKAATKETK